MKKGLKPILFAAMVLAMVSSLFSGMQNVSATEKSKQASEVDLRVMTYNLRYLNSTDPSPHTWAERIPTIKKLIQREQPDIIGTQEAVYQQIQDLKDTLPEYNWIGLGREGGSKGEYSAIFYNENKYTPIEYDHYWLSDTPNVIGSKSWGNKIPRMVTWAKFLDKKSNQQFYVVNTHFDHQSPEAREKSAALILEKTKSFNPDLPVILTGDFNAGPASLPHQTLTKDGEFSDLWDTAQTRVNEDLGTFNGFNDPTGKGPESRIDWILAKGNILAKTIEIINYQKNGQFPSDHYPVMTDLTMNYK
ncbi:endonuclease/exonuclease/phosphatase family protein [Metabacillus hrfriensis]|uniref:Endonuclease/exonuclease/phosphatase family protein n=1 Tax=Metabacillus hrfriensis TaxID=3048891 RepID=A0ACD4RCT2_9BACI|nr:endonuclease/exonuclease/phosphatase family protein [Metabacillus sp. CT-WN-B3]WHZ58212.1 endonuclease/exonuclease/phosphatase family protein [Metabacillus sp. CT-WN-B3]